MVARRIVADEKFNDKLVALATDPGGGRRLAAVSRITTRRALRLPADEITEANIERIMAEVDALSDDELLAEVIALELGPSAFEEVQAKTETLDNIRWHQATCKR